MENSQDIKKKKKKNIENSMEESTRRNRIFLFYVRAAECVLSIAIVSIALGSALPTSHAASLLADLGVAGPVIPLMAMFSNIAVNKRSMPFRQILTVYLLCAIMYMVSAIGISMAWPTINLNETKYYAFQLIKFYAVVSMIFIMILEASLMVYRKVTGKFITNYRIT